MNARQNAVAGAGPLKALKDKMTGLRQELEDYKDRCELAEKKAKDEMIEREKV
jgi:hypothetical protein